MAQLLELALQYQQALDSHQDMTRADLALTSAAHSLRNPEQALETVILRTTLATSIALYFERFSSAVGNPQLREQLQGTAVKEILVAGEVLGMLVMSASRAAAVSRGTSPLAALLLRQVWVPF